MKVAVVIHAFDSYRAGDRITDAKAIADLQAGERAHHVVISDHDIAVDPAPAPDAPAPDAPAVQQAATSQEGV